MQMVNMHEAKTHFSKLVDAAANGEEIIIAKAGVPTAKLVGLNPVKPRLKFGTLKGKMTIPDDFDEPLPDEILKLFEGE
jgi:prevent-host-death family protein